MQKYQCFLDLKFRVIFMLTDVRVVANKESEMALILVFILLILSILFVMRKQIKTGLSFLVITLVSSYAIGCGLVPFLLLQPLQSPFTKNPTLMWRESNAIVMLGAGTVEIPSTHSVIPNFMAYSRLNKTVMLYLACIKTHQQCTVVLSGGDAFKTGVSEAINYREILSQLGVNKNDILLEKNSLNTYQNAEFTSALLKKKKFDQVLLVTAGIHLKRAILYFNYFNIHLQPIPADYLRAYFTLFPTAYNFAVTDFALHEYIGIWRFYVYNFLGWNKNPAISSKSLQDNV
jgi:uncharacterized SAM-binding protein YcdF (DUF218 family)